MSDNTRHFMIAETIRYQITTLDRMALWAWGAKDFVAIPEGQHKPAARMHGLTKPILGGLHFRVNGKTFKGHVYVTLNASDEYDIQAVTPIRTNRKTFATSGGKLKVAMTGVYAEDLVNMLDSFIELGATQEDFETANATGVRGGTY